MIFGRKEVKRIFVKKAWNIIRYTPRPEVANLFGVIPCSFYLLPVCRTKYYEYKKMGIEVYRIDGDYFVRIDPTRGVHEEEFMQRRDIGINFMMCKIVGSKHAKLYFTRADIKAGGVK